MDGHEGQFVGLQDDHWDYWQQDRRRTTGSPFRARLEVDHRGLSLRVRRGPTLTLGERIARVISSADWVTVRSGHSIADVGTDGVETSYPVEAGPNLAQRVCPHLRAAAFPAAMGTYYARCISCQLVAGPVVVDHFDNAKHLAPLDMLVGAHYAWRSVEASPELRLHAHQTLWEHDVPPVLRD